MAMATASSSSIAGWSFANKLSVKLMLWSSCPSAMNFGMGMFNSWCNMRNAASGTWLKPSWTKKSTITIDSPMACNAMPFGDTTPWKCCDRGLTALIRCTLNDSSE